MSAEESQSSTVDDVGHVSIELLAVLKIVNHCKASLPELVTGHLLGIDIGSTVEVTDCFPFLTGDDKDDDESNDGGNFQLSMLRCLREVNVDCNTVGWYQSSYVGSGTTLSKAMIDYQYAYQSSLSKSVVLVYDPLRSKKGALNLQAYRLTPKFMALQKKQIEREKEGNKENPFARSSLLEAGIAFTDVFEEVPVHVRIGPAGKALLYRLQARRGLRSNFNFLSFDGDKYLQRNLEYLLECLIDLQQEQYKISVYNRAIQRRKDDIEKNLDKRRKENAERELQGKPKLPDSRSVIEAELASSFKLPVEPSRLEAMIITNQLDHYCQHVQQYAGSSFTKLYLGRSGKEQDV